MGLKECRECGEDVSSQAKKCPHCGIKNPGGLFSYTGVGGEGCLKFVGCLVGLIVVLTVLGMCSGFAVA